MEDFMFIFIGGEDKIQALSPEEMQQHMGQWMAWVEAMSERGEYKGGHPLKPEGKGISGRDKIVTDGPFAELKELVGGYMLISAANIDKAVAIAKDCPVFQFDGQVEVVPSCRLVLKIHL